MSIDTSSTRASHGFILHDYPSPFVLDGSRWRSVSHWMRENDGDPVAAVEAKFTQNPQLGLLLARTSPKDLPIPEVMAVRDTKKLPSITEDTDDSMTALTNLSNMIRGRGYHLPNDLDSTKIEGFETHSIDNPRSRLVVDVFLSERYTEARLRAFITANERLAVDRRPEYIIMGILDQGDVGSIMNRVSAYANITYFPPEIMSISTLKHTLTPKVRVVDESEDVYHEVVGMSLPEIDHNDIMIKQLALSRGTIMEVVDFSPHYRRVV